MGAVANRSHCLSVEEPWCHRKGCNSEVCVTETPRRSCAIGSYGMPDSSFDGRCSMLGISLSHLKELAELNDGKDARLTLKDLSPSMVDHASPVAARSLVPALCSSAEDPSATGFLEDPKALPYMELALRRKVKDQARRPAVGRATVCVTQPPSCTLEQLVRALEVWVELDAERRRDSQYFWVDVFAMPNGGCENQGDERTSTDIMRVVLGISNTLMVLEPWENPGCFHDPECVWRLFCTVVSGARLHIVMCQEELNRFRQALLSSSEAVRQFLSDLSIQDEATAVEEEPLRVAIVEEIERTMGLHRLYEVLHLRLWTHLVQCTREELERMEASIAECREGVEELMEQRLRLQDHLGRMLREQGNMQEAEATLRKLLEDCVKTLGEDHTQTLAVSNQLAVTLHQAAQDRPELRPEAERLHRGTLERRRRALGENHVDTLQSLSNLAVLLGQNWEEAAFSISSSAKKGASPDASATSRLREAQELSRKALQGRQASKGPEHPATLYTASNLGLMLSKSIKLGAATEAEVAEATRLHKQAAEGLEKRLGGSHPITLMALHNQAQHWVWRADAESRQELLAEAKLQLIEVVRRRTEKLGRDHQLTSESRDLLHKVRYKIDQKQQRSGLDARRTSIMMYPIRPWKDEMPERFPSMNTAEDFREVREMLRAYGMERLKEQLVQQGFIDENGFLTTGMKPFNVFARIGSGVMRQDSMAEDQRMLGRYQEQFVVACNRPECDENWESHDPSWLGKASMSKRHRFLIMKELHWSWFNVLVFGVLDNLPQALSMLRDMREAAMLYAQTKEGWSRNVGLFFHVYALSSVNSLHLHIVDLDNVGPTFNKLNGRNMPMDDIIEVLEEERKTHSRLSTEQAHVPVMTQ